MTKNTHHTRQLTPCDDLISFILAKRHTSHKPLAIQLLLHVKYEYHQRKYYEVIFAGEKNLYAMEIMDEYLPDDSIHLFHSQEELT